MKIRILVDSDIDVFETGLLTPVVKQFEKDQILEVTKLSDSNDKKSVMLQLEDGRLVTLDKDSFVEI